MSISARHVRSRTADQACVQWHAAPEQTGFVTKLSEHPLARVAAHEDARPGGAGGCARGLRRVSLASSNHSKGDHENNDSDDADDVRCNGNRSRLRPQVLATTTSG